jgi:hypothetical protein
MVLNREILFVSNNWETFGMGGNIKKARACASSNWIAF